MGRNQALLPRKPEDLLFPLLLSRSMARQGKQGRSLPWMQKYGASSGLLLVSRMVLLFCQYVSQATFLHRVPAWVIRKKFQHQEENNYEKQETGNLNYGCLHNCRSGSRMRRKERRYRNNSCGGSREHRSRACGEQRGGDGSSWRFHRR